MIDRKFLKLYAVTDRAWLDGRSLEDVIREVTIGPCNGSTPNTVRLFLAKNGFDYANIIIKKSTIPYRTRR